MTFELKGGDEILAKLRRIVAEQPKKAAAALYGEGLAIAKTSMGRTPVDTGALRGSHEVHRPEVSGEDISVLITVGGPAAPYAVIVHEDLQASHPTGEAKFLERSVLEAQAGMLSRLASRLKLG